MRLDSSRKRDVPLDYPNDSNLRVGIGIVGGYDEPEILRSSSYQICLTGAEAGHAALYRFGVRRGLKQQADDE